LSLITQARVYSRLALGLRSFLGQTVTPEDGRETIRRSLLEREVSFLSVMKSAVYGHALSPYLSMLKLAGCEYGDLETMVRRNGIESTLATLRREGVYVSADEFKGRRPIVRGSTKEQFHEGDFKNPLLTGIQARGSGSRGTPTTTTMSLERAHYLADCCSATLDAHGLAGSPTLLWMPALPSSAGTAMLLYSTKMGTPPVRWFSPVSNARIRPDLSKRLATRYIVHVGRLLGRPMPRPEYVAADRVRDVAEEIRQTVARYGTCVVFSTPSNAVRACYTGIDMSGVTFLVSGEPLTPAKAREIDSAGARTLNMYASAECGVVGFGCAGQKGSVDDIHVLSGTQAFIQHRRQTIYGEGEIDALLFTTLSPVAPKMLLNVEVGDYAVAETRDCGCALGDLGLMTHLSTIQSFEKLTGEGMTFGGTDIVRIVEEVLPQVFGGASTDYQFIEEEDEHGQTHLSVIVDPAIDLADDSELVQIVLSELARGNDTRRMMSSAWAEAGVIRLKREPPHVTAGGKLLPLHIRKTQ